MKSIFELLVATGAMNLDDGSENGAMFMKKGYSCASCEKKLTFGRDPRDRLSHAG